ncbi:unnamed protein product [Trichobilharzia szidati]|nr:unnamed protein product [Trichobilharzia szidati]
MQVDCGDNHHSLSTSWRISAMLLLVHFKWYLLAFISGRRRAFWLLQEKTDSLVFGWNRFDEKGISKLTLERVIHWAFDDTLDLPLVDISEFNVIGGSCVAETYNILAKSSGVFRYYEAAKRSLNYKRVPRIEKVEFEPASNKNQLVKWTLQGSPCHSEDSMIMFEGLTDQPLEMTILPIESTASRKTRNSKDVVIILAALHDGRFSLPTLESPQAAIIDEEEADSALSVTLLPQKKVEIYSTAYLEVNAERGRRRAFWLLQEKTDSLVFGWNRFDEKGISKLTLERVIHWAFDDTLDLALVDISEFNVIGGSCVAETYNILAKSSGVFRYYEAAKRSLNYKRAPRIAKVEFEPASNKNQLVKWTLQGSPCHSEDSMIMFEGLTDQPLEMTILPIESTASRKTRNSKDVVIILAALHDGRFSLPTLESPQTSKIEEEEVKSASSGSREELEIQAEAEEEDKIIGESPQTSKIEEEEVKSASSGSRVEHQSQADEEEDGEIISEAAVTTAKEMASPVETTTHLLLRVSGSSSNSIHIGTIVAIVLVSVLAILTIIYFSYRRWCKQKLVK